MKKKPILFLASLLAVGSLTSCDVSYFDNDIDDFTWSGEMSVPVGHATYTLSELFDELDVDDIDEKGDGTLFISYTESIQDDLNDIDVSIDNKQINDEINAPDALNPFDGQTITAIEAAGLNAQNSGNGISQVETIKEKIILDEELTSAAFSDGSITFNFTSQFDSNINIEIEIPSFTKNDGSNTPYSGTKTLTKDTPNGFTVDLKDYDIDFTDGGTTTNTIVLDVTANFVFTAGNTIRISDKIEFEATFNNAQATIIKGDFKQTDFSVNNQSINLDFFDDFGNGGITFTDVSLTIETENGLGIPLGIDMSGVVANNGTSSVTLDYATRHADDQAAPAQFMVFDGIDPNTPNAAAKKTTRVLNKDNSNINELLSSKPTSIDFVLEGNTNPIDAATNQNFYKANNSGINVDIVVDVPLSVQFDNVSLKQDPIELDIAEDIEDVQNVKLTLTTINEIPLAGNIEVIFLKEGNNLNISKDIAGFDAAPIGSNGLSNGNTTKKSTLDFTVEEFETLKEATDVQLEVTFSSPVGKTVRLNSTDEIKAIINIEALLEIEITEDENN